LSLQLTLVERSGKSCLEGAAGQPLLRSGEDAVLLVEACFNNQNGCILLYINIYQGMLINCHPNDNYGGSPYYHSAKIRGRFSDYFSGL
jgi:hypothetical protein